MRRFRNRILSFTEKLRWKRLFFLIPLAIFLCGFQLGFYSRSAALIFNHAMKDQTMCRGNITVENISANLLGEVRFKELLWTTPEGQPILRIPSGSFQVKLWDALSQHFDSRSLRMLRLENASISLFLDENMKLDVVPNSEGLQEMEQHTQKKKLPAPRLTMEELKQRGELQREKFHREVSEHLRNFHHEGRDFKLLLALDRCRIEVLHGNKHYLIGSVNIKADIDTRNRVTLNIHTGPFGGTMYGRGMRINGNIDMTADPVPVCNLAILLADVDPSSLGLGEIHDRMTLQTYFDGPVTAPIGSGTVHMEELHIPGLDFSHVSGDIRYKDSKLEFLDVNAEVYGGTLTAQGIYDFDTRYYRIEGIGENLKAKKALPKGGLSCDVHLELSMESKGSAKETYAYGTFVSGSGFYETWIPFDRIAGRFSNAYRDLRFYDVSISLGGYRVATDAFSIIDKKLTLQPIRLVDEQGRLILTYDPNSRKTDIE